jgi:hypothetical protein
MFQIIKLYTKLVNSLKLKDWATSAAAFAALLTYALPIAGVGISPELANAINAAALATVGFFTGKAQNGNAE